MSVRMRSEAKVPVPTRSVEKKIKNEEYEVPMEVVCSFKKKGDYGCETIGVSNRNLLLYTLATCK